MKKGLLIIGFCMIWGNTLCAQITVNSHTEKRDFVNLLHKKRDSSFLYQKRDSARLAKFEELRDAALNSKPRKTRIATIKTDNASYAKRLGSSGITSKMVNETVAGTLSSYFTDEEKSNISSLTITGKMDVRDFKFIRDNFNNRLLNLDISGVAVEEYTGTAGTDTVGVNKTYPANTIPQYSFWNSETHSVTELSFIVLPSAITTIGNCAFLGQKYLSTITIPSSVTTIQYSAFEQCSFTSIAIPSSVAELEACVFSYNKELTTARIASSTTGLGTFENDSLLSSVIFEPTVKEIDTLAFYNCDNLTTIDIPASVDFIGAGAFSNAHGKSMSIVVNPDNACYSSVHGILFNKDQTKIVYYPAFEKSYTIPSTVKTVGSCAFYNDAINSITIPASVISLEREAFREIFDTCSITFNPGSTLREINDEAFCVGGITAINIPSTVKTIGIASFLDCFLLQSIAIPASVDTIKPLAFVGCVSLRSIYSYATTPPILPNTSAFYLSDVGDSISGPVFGCYNEYEGVDTMTCVLHVPCGSKTLYQAADQWKSFLHIEDDILSGINNIYAPSLSIYPNPATDEFTVLGLKDKSKLVLADSSGRIVMQKYIVPDQHISIASLTKGLYFARINSETIKFIIK